MKICKHCGKPIIWLSPDHKPRWVHGVSRKTWSKTPCFGVSGTPVAEPRLEFKEYLKKIQ